MDPSKEFDELFQEMQHSDRSDHARRNSWLKIQNKVSKKKRHIAPIFISVIMVAVACFLVFTLVNPNANTDNKLATEMAIEDNNKAAVTAVLKSEFTAPNEEFILIQKNLDKKADEIRESLPEGSGGFEIPADSPEWLAYEGLVEETYKPYFMDYMYDHLIPTNIAFSYHYELYHLDEEFQGEMKVSDIQVNKSENELTPKHYDFTAQVEYKNNAGEVSQHGIRGRAILSEEGKMGDFRIRDDGGLREKISEARGY
ncbi:hypothetical protein [Paenisporosarcina indica]|uniref:hypothetical protein n=1 Tax=Paenisporosarcina indica TaxID=650093 RepID=UPI000B0DD176|nr:hypothetical protein [Paenisporosarcina indica]